MKIFKIIVLIFVLAGFCLAGWFLAKKAGGNKPEKRVEVTPPVIAQAAVAESVAPGESVKILAFGDLLLDRYIKREIDRKGTDYTFKNIKDFLAGNDLALANLEGSFTDFKPRPLNPNNTSFTFDPALVKVLKESGFNLVNLANNHVYDFGKDGFAQSKVYLEKSGIGHFGDFYNEEDVVIKEIRGVKIAFVGYNEFGDPTVSGTLTKIKEAKKQADFTVVYAHWGVEYQTNFWIGSQEKGRQFVDAGADVVLGSHPHVVQPIEIYKGKVIFYSLGNFVFDQISSAEVRHGLAVRLILKKNDVEYDLYSTEMKNFQVGLASKEKSAEVLSWLAKKSIATDDFKSQIKTGKFIITKTPR
ncbi:MAG: CapA family protein [Candidatus Paceibacterota bacterium]